LPEEGLEKAALRASDLGIRPTSDVDEVTTILPAGLVRNATVIRASLRRSVPMSPVSGKGIFAVPARSATASATRLSRSFQRR